MNISELFLGGVMYSCLLIGGAFLLMAAWGLIRIFMTSGHPVVILPYGILAVFFLFIGGTIWVTSRHPSYSGSQTTHDKWKQW